jgi:cell division septation protein DedD
MATRLDLDPSDVGDDGLPPSRRRRPNIALIVAVAVLLVAGLWIGHRLTRRGEGPGAIPILHADTRPIKVPPTNPGGMDVPDQDMAVLNPSKGGPKVEQLLPPPETPLPRPAPEAPPPSPAPQADLSPAPAPSPVGGAPQTATADGASQAAVTPPTAEAAPTAVQPAAAPAGSGFRLQLGAVHSTEAAQQEWERLKHAHPDLLGTLGFSTSRVDLGDKGIFFRILAGPIADAAQADHVCGELKQRKLGCILVKP